MVVMVTALRISGETFEARGEVRKERKKERRVRACVRVFVDRAKDARVPPAARTPKAETRAGETYIIHDTAREGENLLLAEWGWLLSPLLLLPILLFPPL